MTAETARPVPPYQGFEQGPIRPPSEANSLLLRITRNCPWNCCTFCPVYKNGAVFSVRPLAHVLEDIDSIHRRVETFLGRKHPDLKPADSNDTIDGHHSGPAVHAAASHWIATGMRSIFLQDGDSLVLKPVDLIRILQHIRQCFPKVERITSYARSRTIDRISAADLANIREAGLNRIHIGMESGSDRVLALVHKGVDKATHIRAGQKVKAAGMELSEYVIPGLGGRQLSREHALETADALNCIDPDFIRLRTLAIPDRTELFQLWSRGEFEKMTDRETAGEILLFLDHLKGLTSTLQSDHILNLFQEIEGCLPQDKPRLTGVIQRFFALSPQEQTLFMVGRRSGYFSCLDDLNEPARRRQVENLCARFLITPDNVDAMVDQLMTRFV